VRNKQGQARPIVSSLTFLLFYQKKEVVSKENGSGFKNQAAGLTAVASAPGSSFRNLLKIIFPQSFDFETFRTATRPQLRGGNCQVAMPAAKTRGRHRH